MEKLKTLKGFREQVLGMTILELATELGVSYSMIYRLNRRGEELPRLLLLALTALAYEKNLLLIPTRAEKEIDKKKTLSLQGQCILPKEWRNGQGTFVLALSITDLELLSTGSAKEEQP